MPDKTPWYCKHAPDLGNAFRAYHDAANYDGMLDDRARELIMVALASNQKCRYCMELHIQSAQDAGATREEVAEALLLASVANADTQLYWAKDIFEKYFP